MASASARGLVSRGETFQLQLPRVRQSYRPLFALKNAPPTHLVASENDTRIQTRENDRNHDRDPRRCQFGQRVGPVTASHPLPNRTKPGACPRRYLARNPIPFTHTHRPSRIARISQRPTRDSLRRARPYANSPCSIADIATFAVPLPCHGVAER